ncbi:hypothetical protein CEXT_771071 [Caerostris extrusa]|uniref:Uncharacterized protein n=1 Tax=Caerostris extrusa TaxID=172846 RepID=A0AAV4PS83_CAEEX|nr:hypothetical protein CEXT_771071 [Caerostris extrusa]
MPLLGVFNRNYDDDHTEDYINAGEEVYEGSWVNDSLRNYVVTYLLMEGEFAEKRTRGDCTMCNVFTDVLMNAACVGEIDLRSPKGVFAPS